MEREGLEEAQEVMECEAQPEDEGVGLAEAQGEGEALEKLLPLALTEVLSMADTDALPVRVG